MSPVTRAIAREASCLIAYAALTVVATYPLAVRAGTALPAAGDSWQFYWNLWWVKRALVDLHVSPFFTPDLFFPNGASLYFDTLNLLPSVLALPIAVTLGLPFAYNLLVFLAFTLSGYGMYRLTIYALRYEIGPSGAVIDAYARLGAFLAGAAFTFSAYHFAHLHGHLDLVSTEWLPFFVLFLLKTRDKGGRRNSIICAMLLAATALTSAYYTLFLLVFAALVVVDSLVRRGRDGWPAVGRITLAVATFTVMASPVLIPMLVLGRTTGRVFNPAADVDQFSTDLLAFLVPSTLHPIWGQPIRPLYQLMFPKGGGL